MKIKELIKSFKYAFTGIFTALKKERNMNIHFATAILVVIFGVVLQISKIEWILCTFAITIVITAELFNTAIETVVDMITNEQNEKAKIAKDVSAGAVLITAIGATTVGIIIFIPKIAQIF